MQLCCPLLLSLVCIFQTVSHLVAQADMQTHDAAQAGFELTVILLLSLLMGATDTTRRIQRCHHYVFQSLAPG